VAKSLICNLLICFAEEEILGTAKRSNQSTTLSAIANKFLAENAIYLDLEKPANSSDQHTYKAVAAY